MDLNYPPWLEEILKFTCLKWLKMHLNYPPMVGENFEISWSQMAKKMHLNYPAMVGENFVIYLP